MDPVDRVCAAVRTWPGEFDGPGLATLGELAMARAPRRRLAERILPASARLPRASDETPAQDGLGLEAGVGNPGSPAMRSCGVDFDET
jgi:hypothetical protein